MPLQKIDILKDLEERDLLYQLTDVQILGKRLNEGPITLYAGFDPTADSLHAGHLIPILTLRRFQNAGHIPIVVIGGGTGLIGDPSGKKTERALNAEAIIQERAERIKSQFERFLDFNSKNNPAMVLNNYEWLSKIKVIEFLRDIGKYFSINNMLAKESVKSRIQVGISYAEFTYIILQSYDFLNLYQNFKCELQIGASDQWGNITAGVDLIRKILGKQVFGLTLPLLTKSDNTKIGKTESGTVWLDPKKTSPYQFYQFWINADDKDVIKFIKYFTFLSKEEISSLKEKIKKEPEKREVQAILAQEITSLVHGKEEMLNSKKISRALFYGNIKDLSAEEIKEGLSDAPFYIIQEKNEIGIMELIVSAGVSSSNRQAKEDIKNGAISVNGEICADINKIIKPLDKMFGKYLIIRRGKKNYFLIKWEA